MTDRGHPGQREGERVAGEPKNRGGMGIIYWLTTKGTVQRFLAVNNIEVKYNSSKIAKRTGELYANNLLKNKRSLKRILPDFIIGAHSEQHSDALITWNHSDYDINKVVMTPVEVMKEQDKA